MKQNLCAGLLTLFVAVSTTGCGTLTGGGEGADRATAIATDDSGGAYVSGVFEDRAQLGPSMLESEDGYDAFFARIDREGEIAWAVPYPSGFEEQPSAMVVSSYDDHVYIVGRQEGMPRIVKFDSDGSWITSSEQDVGCDEFVGIMVTPNRVITACNTAGRAGLVSFDTSLENPEWRGFNSGWAQIRDLRGTRNGIYLLGEFQSFIDFTRRRALAGFPPDRTIRLASAEGTALFVARVDPTFDTYDGIVLTMAARSLGAEDDLDLEAASLAVSGHGDIFVAGRFPSSFFLEPGQQELEVESVPGSDRNFFVTRLDGGLPDRLFDGDNVPLRIEWQRSWGSSDFASAEAIDFRSGFLGLAGTFEGAFNTHLTTLESKGGKDVFYLLIDTPDGEELVPTSGGGQLDEEVWDVGLDAGLGAVAGSFVGDDAGFPLLVVNGENLDVDTEIPEAFGNRDILIWKVPSSIH